MLALPNSLNTTTERNRKVLVMKDSYLVYPHLYFDVFVSGPPEDQYGFPDFLSKAKCTKANDPLLADVVVFTGGPDVNPMYYGEEPHPKTYFDENRDLADIDLYMKCVENGIPMFGVCRGAQFLHVMNGGALYQDVNHHHGDHTMWDTRTKRLVQRVSSVHHQMVQPEPGMVVLGTSSKSSERWINATDKVTGTMQDVEAFFYRDTLCLGVQGHPEYAGYNEFGLWCLDRMQEFFVDNTDVELRPVNPDGTGTKFHRLKHDVMDNRKLFGVVTDDPSEEDIDENEDAFPDDITEEEAERELKEIIMKGGI
jgi:gamma-glutamyl-gamma-aminobutyrate hydrolase PuuD